MQEAAAAYERMGLEQALQLFVKSGSFNAEHDASNTFAAAFHQHRSGKTRPGASFSNAPACHRLICLELMANSYHGEFLAGSSAVGVRVGNHCLGDSQPVAT
jgi:hypothetical protein